MKKDDCIDNFFKLILNDFEKKKFSFFYDTVLKDAKLRNVIKDLNNCENKNIL